MKLWHSARLLFESTVAGVSRLDALREESIRVFLAESEEEARQRAEELGREGEHEYDNDAGERVRWCFVKVVEIQDLCQAELVDGTEVYSTLIRDGEA